MNDAMPAFDLPELDLRGLVAPEPLLRALAAAEALAAGERVCVLTPLLPLPLLDALVGSGLHYRAEVLPAGGARVLIERPADGAAGA
ncbi:MAG: DUF2249 domain-containing protein [Rhodanobacteraceae bacterium]|jgi:hypothetical protein|nr:DUF2249 domain-containing protein [Rhodanobacteraceae bacterium]